MSLIEIKNLNHSFGDKRVFNMANFVVNSGDKIGIVGINGAGKSTLFKILKGDVLPDSADIYFHPKARIGYLDQQAEIKSEKSIFDYLKEAFQSLYDMEQKMFDCYNNMATAGIEELEKLSSQAEKYQDTLTNNGFYEIEPKIEKVCAGLGISDYGLDRPVKNLSGGQRAKVILAKLLLEKPDVLMLDEPTNFLDVDHIAWLEKYLIAFEGTFIVISHDEKFLTAICNTIYDIDEQTITKYNMSYKQYLEEKALRKDQYERAYNNQKKKIEKLEDFIARNSARASTARMAQSRQKQLDKIDILNKPTEKVQPTFQFNYRPIGSKVLLEIQNLEVGYNGKPLLKPLSLTLLKGEKVAICGFNGIGKSTFLKTIAGLLEKISGDFKFATNTIIGYYEQDNIFPDPNQTPLSYIVGLYPKLTEGEARTALSRCGLTQKHIKEKIKVLSGGEQSKIKLCVLSLFPCNVLILDEPTNHLDYLAINQLKDAIKKFDGTVLFVSHDKQFVNELADNKINFEDLFSF